MSEEQLASKGIRLMDSNQFAKLCFEAKHVISI